MQGKEDQENADEPEQAEDEPRKIGYKTFLNGIEAYKYYRELLREITHNQDLNEVCHCPSRARSSPYYHHACNPQGKAMMTKQSDCLVRARCPCLKSSRGLALGMMHVSMKHI